MGNIRSFTRSGKKYKPTSEVNYTATLLVMSMALLATIVLCALVVRG